MNLVLEPQTTVETPTSYRAWIEPASIDAQVRPLNWWIVPTSLMPPGSNIHDEMKRLIWSFTTILTYPFPVGDDVDVPDLTEWRIDQTPNTPLLSTVQYLRTSGETHVYPGGKRPTNRAFEDAVEFVKALPKLRVSPHVGLVADGEINFLWKEGGIHIDLGFYGDGEGSFYARDEHGTEFFCDCFLVSNGIPPEISSLVS